MLEAYNYCWQQRTALNKWAQLKNKSGVHEQPHLVKQWQEIEQQWNRLIPLMKRTNRYCMTIRADEEAHKKYVAQYCADSKLVAVPRGVWMIFHDRRLKAWLNSFFWKHRNRPRKITVRDLCEMGRSKLFNHEFQLKTLVRKVQDHLGYMAEKELLSLNQLERVHLAFKSEIKYIGDAKTQTMWRNKINRTKINLEWI